MQSMQSLQSVFSGRTLGQSDFHNVNKDSEKSKSNDDDDSDDDIERDPAAEIIKPVFRRRNSSQSQKKLIKVKLRKNLNQQPKSIEEQRASMTQSRLAFNLDQTHKPGFEEKVKGQIDHKFIDTLIKNASKKSLGQSNSAWSGIADDLREKIKLTAANRKLQSADLPPPS